MELISVVNMKILTIGEGICKDGILGDGSCTCFPPFSGPTCATGTELCSSCDPIYGSCQDGICTCRAGYYGPNCKNACNCQNGNLPNFQKLLLTFCVRRNLQGWNYR